MVKTELVWCVQSPISGFPELVCVVKRTYALRPGRLSLADEQLPIVLDPAIELDDQETFRDLLDDTDVTPHKPATDVVFSGSAYAGRAATEVQVAVAVGASARSLRVVGERFVKVRGDGTVRFSSPTPFEQLPLGHDVAYGGYDAYAQRELQPVPKGVARRFGVRVTSVFAYPRNAIGRAYFVDVDRERAEGARLPLIEDPGDPLTPERFFVPAPEAWIDAPIPGNLGWVPYSWYPRIARYVGPGLLPMGAPRRPIRETAFPDGADLAELGPLDPGRAHPRALQGAAPALACETLRGDEVVILRNLHREHAELRFTLPGERPVLSLEVPGIPVLAPAPALETVRIAADRGLVALTFCASTPLVMPVDDDFLNAAALRVEWAPL